MSTPTLSNPVGALLLLLVAASVLTPPLSLLILLLYRRAVASAMRQQGGGAVPEEPRTLPADDRGGSAPPLRLSEGAQPPDLHAWPAAHTLYRRLRRAPWWAALAFGCAGLAHAATAATLYLYAGAFGDDPRRVAVVELIFAWPVVLTVVLVAVSSRRWKVTGPLLYAVLLVAVSGSYVDRALEAVLVYVGPPTLILLALSARRLRAAGPLVFVMTAAVLAGAQFALEATYWVLATGTVQVVWGARAIGLFVFLGVGALGVLAVRHIAAQYGRRRVSDQLLLVGTWWLVFTAWEGFLFRFPPAGSALVAPALGAFVVVLVIALRPLRRASAQAHPRRLLLLRVFGSRGRSERLFREVGLHWRYVGPVRLIGAPDLATEMLEPDELLAFLGGRLRRLFLATPDDLDRRFAALSDVPDPDGRYRVEDLFCYDDTWRATVARLVHESDAVLMDLRGFRVENRGVAHELAYLLETIPAGRVVLVEDATTDAAAVRSALAEAWAGMSPTSPNYAGADALALVPLGRQGARDVRRLLAHLCRAATSPAPPALGTRPGAAPS
ncbi:MAG TPA: hypothetical protein VD962_13150 [Rubricoccaceae bacterium]|nr:hypothetical protein [Rubricoccaceae bacterium]